MAGMVRSARVLYEKLLIMDTITPDVFKELLQSYEDVIVKGLDYFVPRSGSTITKTDLMKKVEISEAIATFVNDVSLYLDLDLLHTYDLLCTFLLYDYAGQVRDLQKLLADDTNKKALVTELEQFYRREQLAVFWCTVTIIKFVRSSPDNAPHKKLLEGFFVAKLAKRNFVENAVSCLRRIWTKDIIIKPSPFQAQADIPSFVRHLFTLQEQLVRMLIWLFEAAIFSVECYVSVITLFSHQNFGKKQFYKKSLSPKEADARVERVFYLEMLFAVRALHLDLLLLKYELGSLDELREGDTFWLGQSELEKITSLLESCISATPNDSAGLALGYTLNCQLRKCIVERDHPSKSTELLDLAIKTHGSLAKKADCLGFCRRFLASSAINDDKDLLTLSRLVVYIQLDGCLQFFEAESVGKPQELIVLLTRLLADEQVANAFWSKDFRDGVSQYVLQKVIYRFPAYFDLPVQFLTVLASSSIESCKKVVCLFRRLPIFSEPTDNIEKGILTAVDHDIDYNDQELPLPAYALLKSHFPYGEDGPVISQGTVGNLVDIHDGGQIIQWESFFNAWQVCLLELIGSSNQNAERCSAILALVAEIIEKNISASSLFVHFLHECIGILKRLRNTDIIPAIVIPCLRCLSATAKSFPCEILAQISVSNIIPMLPSSSDTEVPISLISRILNEVERYNGRYDGIVAFLQLIDHCANEEACYELPSFIGSISFICQSIFTEFLSWPYAEPRQKHQIGNICLRISRKVLETMTKARIIVGDNDAIVAVKICKHEFMFGVARQVLLRLASIGPEGLKSSNEFPSSSRDPDSSTETVSLALALLLELLVDYETHTDDMPPIFVDLFLTASFGGSSGIVSATAPICAIARYLFTRCDSRIPKLAMMCLKKTAKLFPATLLSAFGEWTMAICDRFLTCLESPTADLQLKVFCLQFLALAVEYQPGLAERLIGITEDGMATKNALDCVMTFFDGERLEPELAIACGELFATFWRTKHTQALEYLRQKKKDTFWPAICAPLSFGEESYFLAIVSPIFRILTLELLAEQSSSTRSKERSAALDVAERMFYVDRLQLTFKKLREYCESRIDYAEKVAALTAWCDFLSATLAQECSIARNDDAKSAILENTIELLILTMNHAQNVEALGMVKTASEFCLLALKKCVRISDTMDEAERCAFSRKLLKSFEPVVVRLNDSELDEQFLPVCAEVLPCCCSIFNTVRPTIEDTDDLLLIFDSVCSLTVKSIVKTIELQSRNLLQKRLYWKNALEWSLRCVSSCYTFSIVSQERKYLDILQKQGVVKLLVVLLKVLLEEAASCISMFPLVCQLLELTSCSNLSLPMIKNSGMFNWICLKVSLSETIGERELLSLVSLYNSLLQTFEHNVLQDCMNFVAGYADLFSRTFATIPTDIDQYSCQCVRKSLMFFISLAKYKDRWQFESGKSLQRIVNDTCRLCYRLSSFLSKTTSLQSLISKTDKQSNASPKKPVQEQLVEIAFYGIQLLLNFSPDLLDACTSSVFDVEAYQPLLGPSMTLSYSSDSPSGAGVTDDNCLTFGAITFLAQMCINSLRKMDSLRMSSPSASHRIQPPSLQVVSGNKELLSWLLDSAFYFLMSQAMLYIQNVKLLDAWQRSMFQRDLATELSQYLSRCGIRSGAMSPSNIRRAPPTFAGSTSPGVSMTKAGFDNQFLKFVNSFVENVLKSPT